MKKNSTITRDNTHGHTAFLYDSPSERLRILARYFQDGLNRHELCVFVTPDPLEQVIEQFDKLHFDIRPAVEDGSLRIFEMYETYLQDGKFVSDYMLGNVRAFLDEAKRLGYSGLRTAGEMAWLNDHDEAASAANTYESDVNGLCASHDEFIGLCLYPARTTFAKGMLRDLMSTHPSFIYDGGPQLSPYFA